MRMEFTGFTNKSYCMINTLKVRLKDGGELTLDRISTEYTISPSGVYTMTWNGVYLWAINGYAAFGDEGYAFSRESVGDIESLLKDAGYKFELEDDAPDIDYEVQIHKVNIVW